MANLSLIKCLAEMKNIRIVELANAVGLSEQQVHLMVRKNSTKIDTLEKIAKVLDVPVAVFFEEEAGAIHTPKRDNSEDQELIKELREQIAQLKSQLADKERIIKLMEG